jgi:photosystem II stability/assembly factor-like uncharacterized protein
MRRFILSGLFAWCALVGTGALAEDRWVRASPPGAAMGALAEAPGAPGLLYAARRDGAFFRTANAGGHWTRTKPPRPGFPVLDIVVAADDANSVFVRAGGELWHSGDAGETWARLGGDLPAITAFAGDLRQPGTLFAGTELGLLRSRDSGQHWELIPGIAGTIVAVGIDPSDASHLIAAEDAAVGTRVWYSFDDGATWRPADTPGPPSLQDPATFVFDRTRPGVVYLLGRFTNNGAFGAFGAGVRSLDGGQSWTRLPVGRLTTDLASSDDGFLYAATLSGIVRSADAGATWRPSFTSALFTGAPPWDGVERLIVSRDSGGGKLVAAGESGVWISADGASWREASHGLESLPVSSILAAPSGRSALLAATSDGIWDPGSSVFRSWDHGATWNRLHTLLQSEEPNRLLAFDPHAPRTIYALSGDGQIDDLLQSRDGGKTWRLLRQGLGGDSLSGEEMPAFAIDPQRPGVAVLGGTVYQHLGSTYSYLMRTADAGDTWTYLTSVANIRALAIDGRDSDHMVALACDRLVDSRDGGRTWRQLGDSLPAQMCWDPDGQFRTPVLLLSPDALYVGIPQTGVFASVDGGATFHILGTPRDARELVSLALDPTEGGALVLGARQRGVFRWQPGERAWRALNAGLPVSSFGGIVVVDPREPGLLYAASQRGLYRFRVGSNGQ